MEGVAVAQLLKSFGLTSAGEHFETVEPRALEQGWSARRTLCEVLEHERDARRSRRLEKLLKQSKLPEGKTLETLNVSRLTEVNRRHLGELCGGAFVGRAVNVLAFGLPGRGKTHFLCAVGHELILRHGMAVLFVSTCKLVQRLLEAKRALKLEAALKKLDQYAAVIVDDLGYVQQSREEMDVLFQFLAERYERRSVMISSNLVFSQWDKVFHDSMTAMAAVDRLVHHSVILEFAGESQRTRQREKDAKFS